MTKAEAACGLAALPPTPSFVMLSVVDGQGFGARKREKADPPDPSGEPAAYVTWDAIPDRSTVRAGNGPEWPSDSRFRRRRFGGRLFTNPPTPTESWSLIAGLPWPGWTRRNRGAGSTSPRCAVQALGARRRARVLNESEKS